MQFAFKKQNSCIDQNLKQQIQIVVRVLNYCSMFHTLQISQKIINQDYSDEFFR